MFQSEHVDLYRKYLEYIDITPFSVKKVEEIPFLPVEFFKKDRIITRGLAPVLHFESSGTTGMEPSVHYLADEEMYQMAIKKGFESTFGNINDYVFLCLLPAYAEREHSSLVYMMNYLMELNGNKNNGWYLYDHENLYNALLKESDKKIFLLGVTFALLDFAEKFQPDLSSAIVMETGGMKGRRTEMIREEVHEILMKQLNLSAVYSEYGMTELLSQAYSKGGGIFTTPPWIHIMIRDTNDPFSYVRDGQTGGINIIDLANLFSCSFIEVKDLGRIKGQDTFEVLGRFDNSDIRGCSLLYE